MTKEEEFQKMAEQIEAIECPAFALWYLLPLFDQICDRQFAKGTCDNETITRLAELRRAELSKAAKEIRDIVADDLW